MIIPPKKVFDIISLAVKKYNGARGYKGDKKTDGRLTVGNFFAELNSVVENIFQCLNVHVAIELREVSRELD